MSLMLTGYSEFGCQEFVFPEIDNSNYSIFLDAGTFNIPEDIEVRFDVVDGKWRFISVSGGVVKFDIEAGCSLTDGTIINIVAGTHNITLLAAGFSPDICSFIKYQIGNGKQISIGTDQSNEVIILDNSFVSRQHAVISISGNSCTITDTSKNGTYMNGRRVKSTTQLKYGECINLFGAEIIWLGHEIAVCCKY